MKKNLLLFIVLAFAFSSVNAQYWNLTGNAGTNTSSDFIGTTDPKPLIFKTSGFERMQLHPDQAFLGIGVPTPEATLHLHNPQNNGLIPLLQLTTNATGNAAANGFAVFSDYTTKEIRFKQQEQSKFFLEGPGGGFVVAPTGKIGFGTDAPEQKVHVQGKMIIEGTNSIPGGLQFKHPNTSRGIPDDEPLAMVLPHYWDIYSDFTGLKFFQVVKHNGSYTQRMMISNSGKFGIGVTSPQEMLHVGNNILADGNITTIDKFVLAPDKTGNNGWEISRTNTGLNYAYKNQNLNNYFFLGNDGNIGIGKTNPATRLDVNGTITTNALSTESIIGDTYIDGRLGIGVDNPRTNMQIGNIWTFQDAPAGKNIGRNTWYNGTDDVRIQSGVASRISFNNSGDILLQTATSGSYGSIFRWNTVTFSNNGSVGIGTTGTPSAKLEINGDVKAESATLTGSLNAQSATLSGALGAQSATLTGSLSAQSVTLTNSLNAQSATLTGSLGAQSATLTNSLNAKSATLTGSLSAQSATVTGTTYLNGDVGIGINPTVKLDVNGIVRAHEVKVCLNQGCDFVFEEDYKLMNLSDLADFIRTNKHLPDVAPAAKMEAEGINLSEMNALLLRKIEELTLYVLEQDKQMKELNKRLSEVENKKGEE